MWKAIPMFSTRVSVGLEQPMLVLKQKNSDCRHAFSVEWTSLMGRWRQLKLMHVPSNHITPGATV